MKVAIVHDDLVQFGGAERVLEGICEVFPDAPIYTSVFDKKNKELNKRFANKKIVTSFLQKIPGWKKLYKAFLPLYPIAFEQFDFSGYDLVISHTTRFAKAIITKPQTKHICYCHTPPRFLWNFSGETYPKYIEVFLTKLRVFDQISAKRVDQFLAGSKNAQNRIQKIYKEDSKVLYPFINMNNFKSYESYDGGYFVVIARLNKYKRVDLAVRVCLKLEFPLIVIGTGSELNYLKSLTWPKPNLIRFVGGVDDALKNQILAGAKALIISGIEDFGLTALEAQALGKPVIAYGQGGVKETIIEHKTGEFFQGDNEQSIEDNLAAILKNFDHKKYQAGDCLQNADSFDISFFKKRLKELTA